MLTWLPALLPTPYALKDFPYSILHINCPNNSFYVREIPGVGSDVAAIAEFIKARIAELAPRKVVCYGNSMGAFGALLYGYLVECDLIISLAPEVPLGLRGAPSRSVTKDRSIFDQPIGRDVIDLVRPGKTTLFALCGEKAPADLVAGVTLRQRLGGGCHSIRNAYHPLAPFIHAVWGLKRFLLETIETGMPRDFMSTYEGDLLFHPEFVQRLYQLTVDGGDEGAFRELIRYVPNEASAACRAYASIACAQYLGKRGRVAEAVPLLRHAFAGNPDDPVGATLFFEYNPDEFLSQGLGDDYFRDMLQAYRFHRPAEFYELAALLSRHSPAVLERIEAAMGALMPHPAQQARLLLPPRHSPACRGRHQRRGTTPGPRCQSRPRQSALPTGLDEGPRAATNLPRSRPGSSRPD